MALNQLEQSQVKGLQEFIEERTEWQKPADWIDIRSGALNNSIYALVAHSAPVESEGVYTVDTYAQWGIQAWLSDTSHTYDVYVDGVKVATAQSGERADLDWGTLYSSGVISTVHTTSHPQALVYHIVRIAPTTLGDTIVRFFNGPISGQLEQGALWAHYELSNPIQITTAWGHETNKRNRLMEAITAKNDKIIYRTASSSSASGFYSFVPYCDSLVKLPVLEAENTTYKSGAYIAFRNVPAKKIIIKNNNGAEDCPVLNNASVEEIDIENGFVLSSGLVSGNDAHGATNLKKFPRINASDAENFQTSGLTSLQDTVIDDSSNSSRKLLRFYGTSTAPVRGLKGLTVSNEAPFDGASPQLNVSYTGLDRQALRQLFKSMPTVSDSQVCNITGATGSADLTAEDLAIATEKGWSVVR